MVQIKEKVQRKKSLASIARFATINQQLRSQKHHLHLPADSDLRQIRSIPPVAGHHHCTEEKKEKGKKTEIMTQAQFWGGGAGSKFTPAERFQIVTEHDQLKQTSDMTE